MSRLWRAYDATLDGAKAQDERRICGDDAHHLRKVLRLSVGERIELFDGRGAVWAGEILTIDALAVTVRLIEKVDVTVEPSLSVTLFQARLRGEKMEWVLQKATELGVSRVVIFDADRSDAPPIKPQKMKRWQRIVVEASKQSGRTQLLEIETASTLASPEGERRAALILDPGATASPATVVGSAANVDEVWIAIGPEAGFSEEELSRAGAAGWRSAALGPRILRTEGAGLVAATILLHQAGDLGSLGAV